MRKIFSELEIFQFDEDGLRLDNFLNPSLVEDNILPENHPLTKQRTLGLSELNKQHLLLLEDGHCLRDQALEVCSLSGASEKEGFRATSLETLRQMVADDKDVTKVITTKVTNMSFLFIDKTTFNQDISSWDVSNVTDMSWLFALAKAFNNLLFNDEPTG